MKRYNKKTNTRTRKPAERRAPEGYLRLEEAAERLGRAVVTMRGYVRDGKIHFIRPFGNGPKFVPIAEVEKELVPQKLKDSFLEEALEWKAWQNANDDYLRSIGVLR